jgi:hypothetical protein
VWQGSPVPNTRAHVLKTLDVIAIMGLQDVRAGTIASACKTCGQTATMRLQCSTSTVDHSPGTATVQGDPTARHHTAGQGWHDRRIRQGVSHVVEDIICYF